MYVYDNVIICNSQNGQIINTDYDFSNLNLKLNFTLEHETS
jgi:hypothetical protein